MKPTRRNVQRFLKESNALEGVHDADSMKHARIAWEYLLLYDTMNIEIIKHAHRLLMKNQDIESKYKGAWRDVPVWIGGHKKSQPPIVIDNQMKIWCRKTMKGVLDPVALHVEFENVHPFIDGNGRIGRLLMNWHFVKRNGEGLMIYTVDGADYYYELFDTRKRSVEGLIAIMRALDE